MQNPRLAARYAKSLMDLAIETSKIEALYGDMKSLLEVCNCSRDFVMMMKSPVIKADQKLNVVNALFEGKVDPLTIAFIKLITQKGREFFLPEIAGAFITAYKQYNKINDVVLTTATALDDEMKAAIQQKIEQQFVGMSVDLETKVDESLIGGFVLESNNNLFDASILRDLKDIKKQFLKNEYVPDMR
jgi:F-type H+-transporting ATPase subunit delta